MTTFFAFPFEALPTADARAAVLGAFLNACMPASSAIFSDGFEAGDTTMWSVLVAP
jgi:hypothetical protein